MALLSHSSVRLANVAWQATVLSAALTSGAVQAQDVFNASGSEAADIQAQVDAFRSVLGTLNPNVPGSFGGGRREINWDAVPDGFASPNAFPADFFNQNTPGRARGVEFSTPGSGFQVSANAANPTSTPVEFGNIDPAYPEFFETFSPQRLFTAISSNIVDVTFFVPGTSFAALTRGFGVVFTDVDLANTTSLSFFDATNVLIDTFFAPAITGDETFSFLGVDFGSAVVSRVRITTGTEALAAGNVDQDLDRDVVAMDDFIYGEPVRAIPEPETYALMLAGLAALAAARRRRSGQAGRRG